MFRNLFMLVLWLLGNPCSLVYEWFIFVFSHVFMMIYLSQDLFCYFWAFSASDHVLVLRVRVFSRVKSSQAIE